MAARAGRRAGLRLDPNPWAAAVAGHPRHPTARRLRRQLHDTIYYEASGRAFHRAWRALDGSMKDSGSPGVLRRILDTVQRVGPLDQAAMRAARERQDQLTKPQGSLGCLEELAVRLAGITGDARPRLPRKAVLVLAADHGVAAEGVSAYPQQVTVQMVRNFLGGGAAINVLARRAGARVVVIDMGVAADLPPHPDLIIRKIARGTANLAQGPAMGYEQALAAIAAGIQVVEAEIARGLDLVATGDMGIGNTTAASALLAALTGCPPAAVAGRGTGVDDAGLARKIAAIERALEVNQPRPDNPLDVLAKLGGLEIAGLVGVILGAASLRRPILLDGFISGAAALVATELCPAVREYLIAAHTSVEIGHRLMLERMELVPYLRLNLRLGEGTGAVMLMHLVDDALAVLDEMATFAEAGVAGPTEAEDAAAQATRRSGATSTASGSTP